MTNDDKINLIAQALNYEGTLFPETNLQELEEWDSFGILGVIAMVDKHCARRIKMEELKRVKTVQDILLLMESEI